MNDTPEWQPGTPYWNVHRYLKEGLEARFGGTLKQQMTQVQNIPKAAKEGEPCCAHMNLESVDLDYIGEGCVCTACGNLRVKLNSELRTIKADFTILLDGQLPPVHSSCCGRKVDMTDEIPICPQCRSPI